VTAAALDIAAALAGIPPAVAGGYLGVLALLSRVVAPPVDGEALGIAVIVPAHNELGNIAATVRSLLAADYPAERRRVIVLADNCTDATADAARAAGAEVIERTDTDRRGKGFALTDTFPKVLADERIDVVMVVDADTVVSPNLLSAVSAHMGAGAEVLQARYAIRNAEESWRTRLLQIAFAAFHDARSLGRERLGASCGLRGNGMAFSREALRRVPHHTETVIEDLEFGIRLAMEGIRVQYVHEASVFGEMPADSAASAVQRKRWEGGRLQLRRLFVGPLLHRAVRKHDRLAADLALDLLVPPLGQLVTMLVAGLGGSVGLALVVGRGSDAVAPWVWGVGLGGVIVHVARGWQLSGTGAQGLRDLAAAPFYVGWKLTSGAVGARRAPTEWVRTPRPGESG
jgi:1,2-diacylglycerol 3-beta-glucosyltransferase